MAEVVAPVRGLELFAPEGARTPLPITGKRAQVLSKLGIASLQDLLQHYPRRHVDRTELKTIAQLAAMSSEGFTGEVQVHARVLKINRPFRPRNNRKMVMITGRIGDETGTLPVTWFNQEWVARALSAGTEAFFYGRLTPFRGKLQMTAPRFEPVKTGKEPFNVGRIIPIYPTTADLQSDQLRRLIWDALGTHGDIVDPLPDELGVRLGLMSRSEALRLFHFPDSMEDVGKARHRLVFDEIFTLQLGLVYRKHKLERTVQGIAHASPGPDSLATAFVAGLPFTLTRAQTRACDEVAADLARTCPMHRLLEGEVGSGKTVVAVYGCLMAIEGGRQAAIMAPTEVLAEQHHLTVSDLLTRAFGAMEGKDLFSS
ncbi:MAG: OB-fold nucleic acid binding domain-containing protein, partial [Actinomycetota bacterium]